MQKVNEYYQDKDYSYTFNYTNPQTGNKSLLYMKKTVDSGYDDTFYFEEFESRQNS